MDPQSGRILKKGDHITQDLHIGGLQSGQQRVPLRWRLSYKQSTQQQQQQQQQFAGEAQFIVE
jgi:hypothetical protein